MNLKKRFSVFIEKVKKNKKLQFLLIALFITVILLVYITYFIKGTDEDSMIDSNSQVLDSSTEEYVASLENKLSNVLSDINGAGKVSVAITVSSGFVYEYAYEETNKDSLSSSTTSSSLILVNDAPVIISQTYPVISGVLVVAEGGGNIKVKLDILEAIQTLLEVPNEGITIMRGN